jgi:HNH endonuclease
VARGQALVGCVCIVSMPDDHRSAARFSCARATWALAGCSTSVRRQASILRPAAQCARRQLAHLNGPKDPSGFAGGDTNLYAYAYGDPANFVDPNGELAFLVPLAILALKGALIGAATDAGIELASQLIDNGGNIDCLDWGDAFDRSKDASGVPRCEYCGKELDPSPGRQNSYEADHRIPYGRGGSNEFDNLAPSCRSCNRSKGMKTLAEWRGD